MTDIRVDVLKRKAGCGAECRVTVDDDEASGKVFFVHRDPEGDDSEYFPREAVLDAVVEWLRSQHDD